MMTICNTLLLQNKSNFSYLRPGLFIMHYAWDAVVYLLEETNWPTCTNKFSILLSLSFYFKINRPATKQTLRRKDIIRLLLLPKALHLSQAMHRKTICSDVQTLDKFLVYAAEFNIKNSYSVLPWWTNSTICSLWLLLAEEMRTWPAPAAGYGVRWCAQLTTDSLCNNQEFRKRNVNVKY